MSKAVKFQALNTFKPYAVFYRTGGQIEKFHFINGWGASVLTMMVHMVGTKDYTNLPKSTQTDISWTNPLKDT